MEEPWEMSGMNEEVVIEALQVQIGNLKALLRFAEKDRDEAIREANQWREAWEKERDINCERADRFDEAIAKIYEWVGEER
jgi:hypothetical protein